MFNTSIKQVGKSLLQFKAAAVTLFHLVVFSTALYTAGERFKHLQKTDRSLPLHLPEMGLVWSSPALQFKGIQHIQKLLKLCDKTQCYQTWTLNCLPARINCNPRSCYWILKSFLSQLIPYWGNELRKPGKWIFSLHRTKQTIEKLWIWIIFMP